MLINRQLGDYLLVRRLAVGGQSEVFLALKQGPDVFSRPLVLKAMPTKYREDPRFLKLFYQEAFISARFSHPNLISVHDAKKEGEEHFMVMDFVSGQTVSDLAQRSYQADKALTINQVVQIVADASAGLHYAHEFVDVDEREYSVIHCDVSPQNLMVTYDGLVKVFDFGIARVVGGIDEEAPSIGGGKYAYMSPEQCAGGVVDARSDVFSLGIILFELCTGYRLFRRPTRPEVIVAVMEDPIPQPSELSPEIPLFLEQCILKALARDPDERYQTAKALREDLLEFVSLNGGNGVHEELGQHVRELFARERLEIAEILRQATEMEASSSPLDGVALAELSPEWRGQADASMELEVSMLELLPASDESKGLDDDEGLGVDGSVDAGNLVGAHLEVGLGEGLDDSGEAAFQEEFVKITSRSQKTADFVETVELSRDEDDSAGRKASEDYIEMLTGELEKSRKRQRLLMVLILVLVVVGGALGILALSGEALFQEEAPIQLGTEL